MGYINTIIILGGINIIAALGVAILTGYTGLFSIGHAGFMALGGYMSAIFVKELGVPFPIALLVGRYFCRVVQFHHWISRLPQSSCAATISRSPRWDFPKRPACC